jgi:hypothetical protein
MISDYCTQETIVSSKHWSEENPWISTYEISNGNFTWWEQGIEIGRIIFCFKLQLMLCYQNIYNSQISRAIMCSS